MPYRNLAAMSGVRTNNGTEALNHVVKNLVLSGRGGTISLPTLVSSLVFDFLANRLATFKNTVSSLFCKLILNVFSYFVCLSLTKIIKNQYYHFILF